MHLRAADRQHAGAQMALGRMHETGTGVVQDPTLAFALYMRAAEANDAAAARAAARMLFDEVTPQNIERRCGSTR